MINNLHQFCSELEAAVSRRGLCVHASQCLRAFYLDCALGRTWWQGDHQLQQDGLQRFRCVSHKGTGNFWKSVSVAEAPDVCRTNEGETCRHQWANRWQFSVVASLKLQCVTNCKGRSGCSSYVFCVASFLANYNFKTVFSCSHFMVESCTRSARKWRTRRETTSAKSAASGMASWSSLSPM